MIDQVINNKNRRDRNMLTLMLFFSIDIVKSLALGIRDNEASPLSFALNDLDAIEKFVQYILLVLEYIGLICLNTCLDVDKNTMFQVFAPYYSLTIFGIGHLLITVETIHFAISVAIKFVGAMEIKSYVSKLLP